MPLIKKSGTTKSIGSGGQLVNNGPAALTAPGTAIAGTVQPVAAAPTMQPGVVLQGRYQIEGTVGIGGMSVVYRGRDLRFRDVVRACAIKEMYQSAPDTNTRLFNLKNFEREAGLLATVQHAAIPKVYDFFEENGRVYLIMELVPGKDLETVLDEAHGPLSQERVLRWAVEVCDVLNYLHSREPDPIVFRDLKPSNAIVTPEDRLVLIDFGIARTLERTDRKGTMIGTEGYSPPEQYRGVAEPRGDVYALGATLHHLLTNTDPRLQTPFTFHERPICQLNPAVSPAFEAVINRALEYEAAQRWESAEAMKQALLDVMGDTPGSTARSPQTVATKAAPVRAQVGNTEVIWKFKAEDEVRSSPCVGNGMVYVGSYDTNLYALDAKRGEFRWKYATEGGISSSPALWQDLVIVGSEDGVVYALDARRGGQRWTLRTGKAVRSSPKLEDRVILVGSDDQHLYAIDGLRGTQMWQYRTWMPIRSSACVSEHGVFVGGNDGHIYCLDLRNGALKWKQKTQQPIISTPTYTNGLVIVGSMDQNIYALDGEGGWQAWKVRTGHYVNASPCVDGTRVYIGSVDGIMYAIETRNGRVAWKFDTGSQITSSACVEGGRVYVGAVDAHVYCLDAGSGALLWKHATDGAVVSSPTVSEGIVYVGSNDHHLYALKA
ncbi:MAG: PQQ-binding-like beta-propeller repeat protein [Roseiflexaceae bacterium]|nr:PQQ-binding-like beta-propeller repeat protein [Roseiflexaceae bacterium]